MYILLYTLMCVTHVCYNLPSFAVLNFTPPLPQQAGILKAGAAGIECSLKAKHALAQVVMGAAAAQIFTPLDSL